MPMATEGPLASFRLIPGRWALACRRYYLIDQPDSLRFMGIDSLSSEDKFAGFGGAHQAWQ